MSASRLTLHLALFVLIGFLSLAAAESPTPAESPADEPPQAQSTPASEAPASAVEAPAEQAATPTESPPAVIPPEVASAVADLQSDEFAVRRQAEKRLIEMGIPAFESLIALLENTSGETGTRVLLILEQIWLQTPQPQADVLEQQLEEVSLTFGQFQPAVERMLQSHHQLREDRAARSLRRLNAVVQFSDDENDVQLRERLGVAFTPSSQRISTVIIPRSWRGTSADLWHIRRLSHAKILTVFYVRGVPLSEDDKLTIRRGFPELTVSERSEVFIGVVGNAVAFDNDRGCRVTGVQPDSPAQLAGIQVGDLIQKVDGVEIGKFDDLVEQLKSKRGYQPIEMTIERFAGEEPNQITVIGLPWEVRRFPTPPPPPLAESLLDPPTYRRKRLQLFQN